MIAYFDTSAVIPLLIEEPASSAARGAWDDASRAVSTRLVFAEARAALAQARRTRRITGAQLRSAVGLLNEHYEQLDFVEIDDPLVRAAGAIAESLGLRGYDAVHLAAANELADPDLVVVAGDRALLEGARSVGLAEIEVG